MVGSAIWRKLETTREYQLTGRTHAELDLQNQQAVLKFFADEKPDVVIDAAARVGGIMANATYPYQFLSDNLQIQNNLIQGAFDSGVKRFIFLGSSCIYPRLAPQPIQEESLLTGELEPTNQWYAIAKIAGVKTIEALRRQYQLNYVSLMPTNLYGPFDNFDLETSHVLPAMIRKFHDATRNNHAPVALWGSGSALREFLHVDDLAEAVNFLLNKVTPYDLYNVGTGTDLSIKNLALLIQEIVGHKGEIKWDTTKPDGTPRKLLDVQRLHTLGWKASINLEAGIRNTYEWFVANYNQVKQVKIKPNQV